MCAMCVQCVRCIDDHYLKNTFNNLFENINLLRGPNFCYLKKQ